MPHTKRPTPLRDSPFAYTRPAGRRGWIDRVLGRPRADLASQALQHLLAQRDPTRISSSDISTLLLEYDVAGADARSVLVQMWRQVLEAFLADDAFSDREIAYLEALREAFALTDAEVEASQREVVHPRYAVALREALADTRLRDDERESLCHARQTASTSRKRARRALRALQPRADSGSAGPLGRRSAAFSRRAPAARRGRAASRRDAGLRLGDRGDARSLCVVLANRERRFAVGRRGERDTRRRRDLPCCHSGRAIRAPRRSGRVPREKESSACASRAACTIASAASPMRGSIAPRCEHVEAGRLLITSRRVLFAARRESVSWPLRDIACYQVYADGIVLELRAGAGPSFTLDGDVELVGSHPRRCARTGVSSSTKPLLVIAVTAVVIAVPIYQNRARMVPSCTASASVAGRRRHRGARDSGGDYRPGHRPARSRPFPNRHGGLFVILARAIPLALLALAAVATLLAAARRSR